MEKKQRVFGRAPISLKISLSEDSDDISIKFDTANLSEGGIFVKSSLLWEPGQVFNLAFTLPGFDKEIKVKGVVARSDDKYSIFTETDSSIPGMGIKFIDLSDEDREIIKEFISQQDSAQ